MLQPYPFCPLFPYTTLFRSIAIGNPTASAITTKRTAEFGISKNGKTCVVSCVRNRSAEHTSELQSRFDLVCRLLLEKKYIGLRVRPLRQQGRRGSASPIRPP